MMSIIHNSIPLEKDLIIEYTVTWPSLFTTTFAENLAWSNSAILSSLYCVFSIERTFATAHDVPYIWNTKI